jgi:hypothetical protein
MRKILVLFFSLLLFSCSDDTPKVNANLGSPEFAAGEFFYSLYSSKDLERAKELSTKSYARILDSYGSTRGVVRTLYNMSFDEVNITIDRTGKNLREQYRNHAQITMLFEGTSNGNKKVELRVVKMVKEDGRWLVEGVKTNPYARTEV